jgi:excisionase family DNA binding protein
MPADVPTTSPDDFCSTRDAAVLLGVSVKTVQLWVEGGILQAWKTPGGHRRVTKMSVNTLLQQRGRVIPVADIAATPSRFNLLVVDDEATMRRLYELTVPHWGLPLTLSTAKNGFDGLIRIGEQKPDILITDLRMPGMDGFRMINSLRNDPHYNSIRIIVVSGLSSADIIDRGLPSDIPVFPKPIPFASVRAAVENCLVGSQDAPPHAIVSVT